MTIFKVNIQVFFQVRKTFFVQRPTVVVASLTQLYVTYRSASQVCRMLLIMCYINPCNQR